MAEWISVKDRLPENDERVLVCLNNVASAMCNGKIDTDRFLKNGWVRWNKYVTHWMPLPEPPKEDNNG